MQTRMICNFESVKASNCIARLGVPAQKIHQLCIWYGNVTGTIQLTLVIDYRSVRSPSSQWASHNQDCNYFSTSTNRICPNSEYGNVNMNALNRAASSYRNYSGDFLNMKRTIAVCYKRLVARCNHHLSLIWVLRTLFANELFAKMLKK